MTDDATIASRLQSLLDRSEQMLRNLQHDHERLALLERRTARLEFPDAPEYQADTDAIRHALVVHSAHAHRSSQLGTSALAAAEQVWEASRPDYAWFDEVSEKFPGIDPTTISPSWGIDAANDGALFLYRGFRGEQIVDQLLSNLGLPVPPGFEGYSMAAATNNPASDLVLHTASGDLDAQVKVTADAAVIREHLSTNPDVNLVYASSDAADAARQMDDVVVIGPGDQWPIDTDAPVVVDIGYTSGELGSEITDALAGQTDLIDEAIDMIPLAAMVLVAARAVYRLATTDDDGAEIASRALNEGKDVLINASVGELAGHAISEAIGGPITMGTAVARAMAKGIRGSIDQTAARAVARTGFLDELAGSGTQPA